jgi:hypothetical protein
MKTLGWACIALVSSATCTGCVVDSGTPDPFCGDTIVDRGLGEACDEGALNGMAGSFCTETCELLPGCGNGQPDEGEECDDAQYGDPQQCDECLRYSPPSFDCRILPGELAGRPLAACRETPVGSVLPDLRVRALPLVNELAGWALQIQQAMDVAPDGSAVFIAYGGETSESYALVIRANADGTLRWITDLRDEIGGQVFAVEVVDDMVFVGGQSTVTTLGARRLFATLDDATGTVITDVRGELYNIRDFAREPSGEVLVIDGSGSVSHIDAEGNLTDSVRCGVCTEFVEGDAQIRILHDTGSSAWDGAGEWMLAPTSRMEPDGAGWLVFGHRDDEPFVERHDASNGPVVATYDLGGASSLYAAWSASDGRVYVSVYDDSTVPGIVAFDR